MKKEEIDKLRTLLNKYFQHEFDFYRKAHDLVYGDGVAIEDIEPESLFLDIICKGHPYEDFMNRLEKDIFEHIKYVFILDDENWTNRFKEKTDEC